MRVLFFSIPLILFFCVILIFFYFLIIKRDPSELPSVLINKKAPIFNTPSLINNENFIFAEEFGSEIVIVNFFATWCTPCRIEHKYIDRLSKEGTIKVIGINYKDNSEEAIKWLIELGNPYSNIAVDLNGYIGMDWGVYGIPETFIVNKDNIIKYRLAGPITEEIYDDFFKQIMEIN